MDGVARREGRGTILPVGKLPSPPTWKRRVWLTIFGLLIFIGGAIQGLVLTAIAISRNDFLAAVVASGWAMFFLGMLAGIAVGWLRSEQRVGAIEQSGVTFRPDPLAAWLLGFSFLGGALASGFTLLFRNREGDELPFSSVDRVREPGLLLVLFVCAAICLGVLIVRRRGHFRLTPTGIENSELFRISSATWDDVTAITPTAPQKPRRDPFSFYVKDTERPMVVNNASGYATNGAALYWMVRHYWLHPENRGELADGRALERLRTEDFVPE